jgi:hypothetical protein
MLTIASSGPVTAVVADRLLQRGQRDREDKAANERIAGAARPEEREIPNLVENEHDHPKPGGRCVLALERAVAGGATERSWGLGRRRLACYPPRSSDLVRAGAG